MLLHAVRHAESRGNIDSTVGPNSGLSALGARQSDALAAHFFAAAPSAVYCSPYVRCIETALPLVRRLGRPVRIRPDLCEYQGLPPGAAFETGLPAMTELAANFPEITACPDWKGQFSWPAADESFEQLILRMRTFATYLKARWIEETDSVVVISHGSPIARLVDAWLTDVPGPTFRFIVDNAAVSALRFHSGVSSLIGFNQVHHLSGLAMPAASNFTDQRFPKAIPPTSYW